MTERKHAILSASTAHRWLECTPSARLEEAEGTEECSMYAAEGTAAHALAELKLSYRFGKIGPMAYDQALTEWHENPEYEKYYNQEFEDYVDDYVNNVCSLADAYSQEGKYYIYFEFKVNFSNIVPQGFGTADTLIVTEDTIHVVDLKFGKGVPVTAIGNPQLRLYGMGALNLFPNTKFVKTTIIQPRLASSDTEILSKEELLDWAINYVVPRAEEAIQGKGKLHASEDACRFCKLRGKCKERADMQLESARREFEVDTLENNLVQNMSPERIAEVLTIAPMFIEWFKDVQTYALGQLMQGKKIPGFKLVEGRSIRQITNPDAVKQKLLDMGFKEDDILKPREMLPLTSLEKLVGKKIFANEFADYIEKPMGKLTLAPEDDRRPEVTTRELAISDFSQPIEEE